MHWFFKFIIGMKLYLFRTVPLFIIRSFSLYTQQWYMSYRLCWQLSSRSICFCSTVVSKHLWHIPLLCAQWKTPDDGQRKCPKQVEFHSKNKFEKLVHMVGFILRNSTSTFSLHVLATVLTFRLLMSYVYGAPILDVSRSHTTTQHSR